MRTMSFDPSSQLRADPAIVVGDQDLRSLRALVERHAGGPASTLAERLRAELRRAIVVPQATVPPQVVGIGSRVALVELDTALRRDVVLVLPEEAGVGAGRLSVLSPLAVALLGAARGETVGYAAYGGGRVEVRILAVSPREDGP